MKIKAMITKTEITDINIIGATLLSIKEAETLLTQEERTYPNRWWLRSPGYISDFAASVRPDGSVHCNGCGVGNDTRAIRPALQISNLQSSNLKVGDRFEFGGQTFRIISNNLAFCGGNIGYRPFREDWQAEDANIYEVSDVKQIVDEWFNANIS